MKTRVKKWGNSSGTLLPAALLEQVGLAQGDPIRLNIVDGAIVITPDAPSYSLQSLLDNTPESNDGEWDTGGPVGLEEI